MKKSNFCLIFIVSLIVFSGLAFAGAGNGLVGKYYAYVELVQEGSGNIWSATYDDTKLAFTRLDPNINYYSGEINMPLCTGMSCPSYLYVTWSPIDQGLNDQYRHLCSDPDNATYVEGLDGWRNECFGVIWTGYIEIDEPGWYSFATGRLVGVKRIR